MSLSTFLLFVMVFISSAFAGKNAEFLKKTYGIQPNCSEEKITIDQINELAKSPKVTDINSFLSQFPKGAMQGFTFMLGSQSLHRGEGEGKVSPLWPRVLRFSADAKIIISYICHPKNKTYNQIEVLFFDDKLNAFQTVSYDLNQKETSEKRIAFNKQSCKNCHSYQNKINGEISIKPIWKGYPEWGDCKTGDEIIAYGAHDDRLFHSSKSHRYRNCRNLEHNNNQLEYYMQFRELQKDNPCFNLLPWPKLDQSFKQRTLAKSDLVEYISRYPYNAPRANKSKISKLIGTPMNLGNLSLRTNLRLTKALSNLNARRIFHLMKSSPLYNEYKHTIAMESMGCFDREDSWFGLKEKRTRNIQKLSGQHINAQFQTPVLFKFSKEIGMHPGDWSLLYNDQYDPTFKTAVYGIGRNNREELDIHHMVSSLITHDVTGKVTYMTADHHYYGSDFACIDEINPSIASKSKRYYRSYFEFSQRDCRDLRYARQAYINSKKKNTDKNLGPKKPEPRIFDAYIPTGDQTAIESGKSLVNDSTKGKCILCHSPNVKNSLMLLPKQLLFIPASLGSNSDNISALRNLRKRSEDLNFKNHLLNKVYTGEMPLNSADDLTEAERLDIIEYLNHLVEFAKD